MSIAFKELVDTSGLFCPLPILKAKKALATVQSGEVIKVITTDPHAVQDFQAFCQQTQNKLLAQEELEDDQAIHYIERR